MERPKNLRDSADDGNRLPKKPRSENDPPSLFNFKAPVPSGPSPSPFAAFSTFTRQQSVPLSSFGQSSGSFAFGPSAIGNPYRFSAPAPSNNHFNSAGVFGEHRSYSVFGTPSVNNMTPFGAPAPIFSFGSAPVSGENKNTMFGAPPPSNTAPFGTPVPTKPLDIVTLFGQPTLAHQQGSVVQVAAPGSKTDKATGDNDSKTGVSTVPASLEESSSSPGTSGALIPSVPAQVAQRSAVEATGITIKQEKDSQALAERTNQAVPLPMPDPQPRNVGVFDSRGDLTLVTKGGKFRVSSRSLALASPVWEKKLDGMFYAVSQQAAGNWEVPVPDDNPDALRIILQAVHYKFNDMPKSVSRATLFHTALLCYQYDMLALLKPFWNNWFAQLPQRNLDPETFVQQLWIAYALGHLQTYKDTLIEFICSARKHPGSSEAGLFFPDKPKYNLHEDAHLESLGILRWIGLARQKLIDDVAERLTRALYQLSDSKTTTCRALCDADLRNRCDCAMLGGLYRALRTRAWYFSGAEDWPRRVPLTVRQLVNKMEGVRVQAVDESRVRKLPLDDTHKNCTPWTRFDLADILEANKVEAMIPLSLEHFRKQQEQSGLANAEVNPQHRTC